MEKDKSAITKHRYNRIAPIFNKMDKMVKGEWRKRLLSHVNGDVLEVGVGTGANLPYYPEGIHLTAIDFSPKMLTFAEKYAEELQIQGNLLEMDAEMMTFPNDSFDYVVTTCVFCSVPDPIKGLKEIRRVLKPGGKLLMLEHMRSDNKILGLLMDMVNPIVVKAVGANINRRTMENLSRAGFKIASEKRLMGTIMRELVVEK